MTRDLTGQDLRDILQHLQPETQPAWGRMTAQHMVEHLSNSIKMSNGKKQFPTQLSPDKVAGYKAFLLSDKPFPRGTQTPGNNGELLPLRHQNLEAAINELEQQFADFRTHFASDDTRTENHPLFGELNRQEWERFHQKHFTHHFTQFGLL